MNKNNNGLDSQTETITPEIAAKYLATVNPARRNIRPIQKSSLARIVLALRSGQWRENGESIKFNKAGHLFDGQHRLTACVITGIPIRSIVVRNAEEEGVDEGCPRTMAQLIAGAGEKNSVLHASLTRNLIYLEAKRDPWRDTEKITNAVGMKFRESMDMEAASRAVAIGRKCRLLPPAVAASFFYMAQKKHDADALEAFLLNIENGEDLHAGSPRMEIRRWLEGRRQKGQDLRTFYRSVYIALIRAWTYDSGARTSFYRTALWSKINDADLPDVA